MHLPSYVAAAAFCGIGAFVHAMCMQWIYERKIKRLREEVETQCGRAEMWKCVAKDREKWRAAA